MFQETRTENQQIILVVGEATMSKLDDLRKHNAKCPGWVLNHEPLTTVRPSYLEYLEKKSAMLNRLLAEVRPLIKLLKTMRAGVYLNRDELDDRIEDIQDILAEE